MRYTDPLDTKIRKSGGSSNVERGFASLLLGQVESEGALFFFFRKKGTHIAWLISLCDFDSEKILEFEHEFEGR